MVLVGMSTLILNVVWPAGMPACFAEVVLGSSVGFYRGSRQVASPEFKRVPVLVLVIVAVKLVAT